jgi:aldose 1-epimerase
VRTARRLGDLDELDAVGMEGIDHGYVLDPPQDPGEPQVTPTDPVSGRRMTLWTDQPGFQVYTGQLPAGSSFASYGGLCLEPQRFPDAPNRPDSPSATLRPGEVYRHRTVLRFEVR